MSAAPITLTDAAARRLADLSRAEGRALMLRVAVDGGGCSGFQYRFDLVETVEDDDLKVERAGDLVSISRDRGLSLSPEWTVQARETEMLGAPGRAAAAHQGDPGITPSRDQAEFSSPPGS